MECLMENLWACLPSREDEAKTVIHRIILHFQSGVTSEEKDVSLHLMFQETKGIQSFLKASSNCNMRKITSDILEFLSFLLECYTFSLEKYIVVIRDIAMSFIQRKSSLADEKDKALNVLITLFRAGPWTKDLGISSIVTQLLSMTSHTISKPTVLCQVYRLIGVMAELYPHDLAERSSVRLFSAILADLNFQTSNSSKVEFSIIEGCFEGLSGYLSSFPLDESVEGNKCKTIANCILKVLKVKDVHRKTAHRAALNVIARHGNQFQTSLVSNFDEWHRILLSWLGIGKEERVVTKQALLAYYDVVANHISSQGNSKEILEFFSRHFQKQFETSENIDIAVKGFGLFARPMKIYSPEEIPNIFNILAQKSSEESAKNNHHKLADYLDSLSTLSAEAGVIHNLQLAILEGLSVHLICQYAQEEHPSWQAVMVDSIICSLLRLNRCSGSALEIYMNTIVHQGIIRSVSHPVIEDAEMLLETGQRKIITYENYLPFWQSLITLNKSNRSLSCRGASIDEKREVSKKIINKILQSILEIINRLDLSLKESTSQEPIYHCNVEKCMEACNPQDFTVLVNLVNFTVALLSGLPDLSPLSNWISELIQQNIRLSTKHPLVSSFYKLLANTILIAQKLDYFEEEESEMEDVEWRLTVNLLSGFLHDVIARQAQYRGDLQVSCLRLMLSTPSCIATPLLRVCVPAFQSVFRLGCSMLSLAQEGLQTLSRWNRDIPEEKMRVILKAVLPSFDGLLQTKNTIPEEEDETSTNGIAIVKKVLQDQKKKKLWKHRVNTHVDTELVQLQKEVVSFISSLDSTSCLTLLDGSDDRVGMTAWQKEKLLLFPLPFPDMKVEMNFDDILPRLTDLAVNCSDRQTRSTACESLHAVIMFMLGKEKQLETAHQGHLTCLWTRLFPIILSLACDMDLMVNQLFKPLGEQLAHWYAHNINEKSEQSEAFLTALQEGITHQTNAALRDYAATCLHEYVEWARRQGNMIAKVGPLIKYMVSLCHHPCPQKRLGASLAFNSMYTVLREDLQIVDEYWFELLYSLVVGLSLCSVTGEDSHTEGQIDKSLKHVLRVLIECSNKFNLESSRRRIPKEFSGKKLYDAVRWILKYCTASNPTCRHSCMNFVDRLASYVTDCRSAKDFVLNVLAAEGPESLLKIAEGESKLLTTLSKSAPWDQALEWVYSLIASTECYIWLVEIGSPPDLLLTLDNSKLMKALLHFLESIVHSPVNETPLWRPKAMEHFSLAKCSAILRIIEYLTSILNCGQADKLNPFWSSHFWKILIYCCLKPSHVGFDSKSKNVEDNMSITLEKFLRSLMQHSSGAVLEDLKSYLKDYIFTEAPATIDRFNEAIRNDKVISDDRDLLRGLIVLQNFFEETQSWCGLVGETSLNMAFQAIVVPILNSEQCAPVALSPMAKSYAVSMLEFYFSTNPLIEPLLVAILDESPLCQRDFQCHLTHGEYFLACFETPLIRKLLKEPKLSISFLMKMLSPNIAPQRLTFLLSIIKFQCLPKSQTWFRLQDLVVSLFENWSGFATWGEGNPSKEAWLISLLNEIVKLDIKFQSVQNSKNVSSWILKLLTDSSRGLSSISDLLYCLPIICSNSGPHEVKDFLQLFKNQHFPSECSELPPASEKLTGFKRAFEALLHSLVLTGSTAILHTVVKVMTVDPKHVCYHLLPTTLENFMKQLNSNQDRQVESLQLLFSMFDNDSINKQYRIRILNDFLLRLMHFSCLSSQKIFATSIINKLVRAVNLHLNVKSPIIKVQQILLSKIGAWRLLQQIYSFPVKSLFEEKGSELVQAAFVGTDTKVVSGKELTTMLTKKALESFQNHSSFENLPDEARGMYREFLCAVYNMFSTLVCNVKTQPTDAKFYDKFLFDEKSKKIWRLLVDEKKCYMFPYTLTEHLATVKKIVSIRGKRTEENVSADGTDIRKTHLLIGSQSFAGSLETDITRFDFTHSKVFNSSGDQELNEHQSVIILENDSLNDHECMPTVCCVIRHMVDSGISPTPAQGTEPVLPGWMDSFRNSMLDHTNSRNSCIFLLRVILNCESYFSPYAKYWVQPILDCTVRTCLESGISYLLGDIVFLLSRWSSDNPYVDIHRDQANKLMKYLVERCPDTKRPVFKYHLDLIKSIVEVWKKFIDIPHDILLKMLSSPDRRVGINLTAIMLFNDLTPWTVESKEFFISFLLRNLQDNTKEIFSTSSETLGLCLKCLSKTADGKLPSQDLCIIQELEVFLKNVHLKQRDCDRFLVVLHGVAENYPPIVDSFVPTILFYLDQVTDNRRSLCLSLLAKRLEELGENPYQELKGRGLLAMLSDRNNEVQVQALEILTKLAPSLQEGDLSETIHEISAINRYVKGEARNLAHEISLIAFDRYSSKLDQDKLSDIESKIYNESKALLLFGLVDPNKELQRKCFLRWTQEERLPQQTAKRLTEMFSLMYSPLTEQHFLSYSVPLMLDGTTATPDFQSFVFSNALEDCPFEDHKLLISWRIKNAQMAPMFAQTLSSQINQTGSQNSSFDSSHHLLATQNSFKFQPTADFGSGNDGSSQNADKLRSSLVRSSFLFTQDGGYNSSLSSASKLKYKQGVGFGSRRLRFDEQNHPEVLEEDSKSPGSSFRPYRYFGKNTAGKVFGMANVRKARRREEMWKERARRREGQISLYRNYRKGDFPDIQIKFSDFINPLMELSKRDTIIAKKIMVSFFVGIKKALQSTEENEFLQRITTLLNELLKLSTNFEPSTIGACLEIAYYCELHLNPTLISEAALSSDLLPLGVLLLEIIATESNNDENVWLHLAELYSGIGEKEVAHATLLHNVPLGNTAKAALESHADEQWLRARRLYFEALAETKYDNFYESCFKCMEVLSEWSQINNVIRQEVDGELDNLWDSSWYEQKLLPRLLQSEVLGLIQENKDEHHFMNVMNRWLKDNSKGAILKDRFSETLSICCLLKKDFSQSRFFASKTLSKFVDEWSELNPLFRKRRETSMLSIHAIADVMGFFIEVKETQFSNDSQAFLKKLDRVLPISQDSLMQWEKRICYRIACMNCMPVEMQGDVQQSTLKMQLSLVEAALQQGNQNFAKKYLTLLKAKNSSCPVINTRFLLARCWERLQWALKEQNFTKRLDNLIHIWTKLDGVIASEVLNNNPELSVSAHGAESDLSFSIKELLSAETHSLAIIKGQSETNYNWLCRKLQLQSSSSSDEFVNSLETIGLTSLIHSSKVTKELYTESSNGGKTAEAYLRIAQYCRKIIESKEDLTDAEDIFSKHLLKSILSAMKFGSNRARQLFPLILQLPTLSSDLSNEFKEKSCTVPVWMFLDWIPQILALLDTPAAHVVSPLLLNIAEKYPNAVSYPYNISRENYIRCSSQLQVINKLDSLLLSSSLQIQLVRALSCLTHPSVILKDYIDKLTPAVNSSPVDWDTAKKVCKEAFDEILEDICGPCLFTGKFFQSIQKQNLPTFFQELHGAINSESQTTASEIIKKITSSFSKLRQLDSKNIKPFSKLKDFSPWLSNFSSSKKNSIIEIPGQYTANQKPTPERHITISRFDDTVQVMSSLRKPVKLTIIGSDANSYKFLVKYGEDLRQDERVQQLLGLMNGIFSNNHLCRESHLSVFTYKVVPLSNRLGLIEWVDNTSSLNDVMMSSVPDDEANFRNAATIEHNDWLSKAGKEVGHIRYGKAHKKFNRKESEAQFLKLVAMTKPNILTKGLAMWSSSAEAFYWLRHSFITSYSTLCIAHWLLGVGDRHLNNCLVSQTNGQCIGIDFGHIFGSATQFLPVPELMPFRLTPHIVNLVQPHGTKGLIEETMVNALRALRADPEVLLSTMQVFIQEPSLDWLVLAKKHFSENKDTSTWLPALKIQQANRKLKGVNPMVITKEDIESKGHSEFKEAFLLTLLGDPAHNIRAKLAIEDMLSPRQQVECLIDLATDSNVLVKTWSGWQPWM